MIDSKLAILEPKGYITAANVNGFQASLNQAVRDHQYNTYLVDMTQVEFLDSAGLMALVSAFRLAQSRGKSLSICALAPSVKMIFELTQLDKVITVFENRRAFFACFKEPLVA